MKTYYHITKQEYLDSIFAEGLKPSLGDNSQLAYDNRPLVYLCKEKDLPYWQILLNNPVVLQVELDKEPERFYYGLYSEYICEETIPTDCIIKVVDTLSPSEGHMKQLCLSYISCLSRFAVDCARYYDGQYDSYDKKAVLEDLRLSALAYLNIFTERLDFSVLTKEEVRKELIDIGESGDYSFCDTYNNTDIRLYEQLLYYPEDELSEVRKKLYNFIKDTFEGCLDVNTGGWTGYNCNYKYNVA